MQRVNFLLRLCLLTLFITVFYTKDSTARNYIPARKIGVKNAQSTRYNRNQLPPGMVRRSDRRRKMTRTVYRQSQKPSGYFKKQLAGPYVGLGIGVQMHRHDGRATDSFPQEHQFDANDQGFNLDIMLGWIFGLPKEFFVGLELGFTPIPLSTGSSVSDGTTTVKIKGQQGFNLTAIGGRHYLDGQALIYLRLGLEWRKFDVRHEVQDNAIDDIDDNKIVFGWSPGLGIGFLLCNYVYMIAEFRTIFYQNIKFTSPGGRLTFNDSRPRVDIFLLKFVLPLNQCFGTSFGTCNS